MKIYEKFLHNVSITTKAFYNKFNRFVAIEFYDITVKAWHDCVPNAVFITVSTRVVNGPTRSNPIPKII